MFSKPITAAAVGLLFLAEGIAATRIKYVGIYEQGIGGKEGRTGYLNSVPDECEHYIIEHVHGKSGGKYKSYMSKYNILTVENVHAVKTKGDASGVVEAERKLVNEIVNDCKGAPNVGGRGVTWTA